MLFYGSLLFSFVLFLFYFILSTLDIIRDTEQHIGQSRYVIGICFMRADISHNQDAVAHKINGASGLSGYPDAS